MRNRVWLGLGTFLLAAVVAGCGSDNGGQDGATEDQMKDPAWVQARIKELDKDPTVAKPKASSPKPR